MAKARGREADWAEAKRLCRLSAEDVRMAKAAEGYVFEPVRLAVQPTLTLFDRAAGIGPPEIGPDDAGPSESGLDDPGPDDDDLPF